MICFPNAKINLGLNIIKKRTDGFHNIETIMIPIPLFDVLEFSESDNFSIKFFGETENLHPHENTIYKTWEKLKKNYSIPAFEVKLLKNIPIAAGLGGGSSDASFFLRNVNTNYNLGLSNEQMEEFITEIGNDCPFFIKNEPAFASSMGEMLSPIDINLKGKYISLIKPAINIPTSMAYGLSNPRITETNLKEIITHDISFWANTLKNDFEEVIEPLFPDLHTIKKTLYQLGADYVSLSGSGSTIFAISKQPLELTTYKIFDFYWQKLL